MKIHVRHRRAKLRQHGYIKYRTQTIKIQRKLILNSTYGKLDYFGEREWNKPFELRPYMHPFIEPGDEPNSLAIRRGRTWQSYTPELREQVAGLAKATVLSMQELLIGLEQMKMPPVSTGPVSFDELAKIMKLVHVEFPQLRKKDQNEPE